MSDEQTTSDDVEGHKVLKAQDDDSSASAGEELEQGPITGEEADVEGHRVLKRVLKASDNVDDQPDVEGHKLLK